MGLTSSLEGFSDGADASFAGGVQEGGVIFEANGETPTVEDVNGGTDGGDGFDDAGVNASVNQSEGLFVLRSDGELGDHFVGAGGGEFNVHGFNPAVVDGVKPSKNGGGEGSRGRHRQRLRKEEDKCHRGGDRDKSQYALTEGGLSPKSMLTCR